MCNAVFRIFCIQRNGDAVAICWLYGGFELIYQDLISDPGLKLGLRSLVGFVFFGHGADTQHRRLTAMASGVVGGGKNAGVGIDQC